MFIIIPIAIWGASLVMCIVGARRMHLSVSLAIFFGVLFSPLAGMVYGYMQVSGDRTPWRIVLVGIGLGGAFGVVVAVLLASINQTAYLGKPNSPEQSAATSSVNQSGSSGSQTTSVIPIESAQSKTSTTSLMVVACQSGSTQCFNVSGVVRYDNTLDALGNRTLYLQQVTLPDEETHSYTQSRVVLGSHEHPTLIYDDKGSEWMLSIP